MTSANCIWPPINLPAIFSFFCDVLQYLYMLMHFIYIHEDLYSSFTHDFSEIIDAGSSL